VTNNRAHSAKLLLVSELALCIAFGCAPAVPDDAISINQKLNDYTISAEEIKVGLNYFATWSWDYYNWRDAACAAYGRCQLDLNNSIVGDPWTGVIDFYETNSNRSQGWEKFSDSNGTMVVGDDEIVVLDENTTPKTMATGSPSGGVSSETYERMWKQLKPYAGFYDLKDPKIVEAQIRQAKAHGFHYFNFWWYWQSGTRRVIDSYADNVGASHEAYNAAIHDGNCNDGICGSFTKATNTNDMKFMITAIPSGYYQLGGWVEHDWVSPISMADENKVFQLWLEYFSMPNYLRTAPSAKYSNGQPIINLLVTTSTNDPACAHPPNYPEVCREFPTNPLPVFIANLKKYMMDRNLPEPYVLIDHSQKEINPGDGYSCFDEWLANVWIGNTPSGGCGDRPNRTCMRGGDYAYAVNMQNTLFASYGTGSITGKWSLPGMFTDYHELHRGPARSGNVDIRFQKLRSDIGWVNNWSRWQMRQGARSLRDGYLGFTNSTANPLRGLVSVHAWNEWGEQLAAIEPSAHYEDEIAAYLAAGFGLSQKGRKSCRVAGREDGDCTFDVFGVRWLLSESGVRTVEANLVEARSNKFSEGSFTYEAGIIGDTILFFSRYDAVTQSSCQYWGTLTGPNLDRVVGGTTDCGAFSWNLKIIRERIVQRTISGYGHSVTWPGHKDYRYSIEAGALAFPVYETGDSLKVPIFNCPVTEHDEKVSNNPDCAPNAALIGFLWVNQGEGHNRTIYGCQTTTHFISESSTCEGAGTLHQVLLGWADDTIVVRRTAGGTDHGVDFAGFKRLPLEPGATSFRVDTREKPGQQAIYNCLVGGSEEMLSLDVNCEMQPAATPKRVGFLYTLPGPGHNRAIYRCAWYDHYVSDDPYCERGAGLTYPEVRLGYTYDTIMVSRTAGNGDHGVAFGTFSRHPIEIGAASFSLNTISEVGQVPLYNCLSPGGDEMVSRDLACAGNTPTTPSLIGYAWPSSDTGHTQGIYRCLTPPPTFERFVSLSANCEISGAVVDSVLGYIP